MDKKVGCPTKFSMFRGTVLGKYSGDAVLWEVLWMIGQCICSSIVKGT